jgi:gluconolactonase
VFAPPPVIQAEVWTRVPDSLRMTGQYSPWLEVHRRLGFGCFLEGPSFDRDGNFYCTDIPFGRVFRVTPQGQWDVIAEYDGEPNGLKIHKDGRFFIADHKRGLLILDPNTGKLEPYIENARGEKFKGVNDLFFADGGNLYFTDQGQTGLQDPTGRLFRYSTEGQLEMLLNNVPSPNGVVVSADESQIFLAVTRANNIWRVLFTHEGKPTKVGVFVQMSGGVGPDGIAMDEAGNLVVCHFNMGSVWVFSPLGEPLYRIKSAAGLFTTNCAFGGADRKTLYITESETGSILRAQMNVPGRALFSHA